MRMDPHNSIEIELKLKMAVELRSEQLWAVGKEKLIKIGK